MISNKQIDFLSDIVAWESIEFLSKTMVLIYDPKTKRISYLKNSKFKNDRYKFLMIRGVSNPIKLNVDLRFE